MAVRRPSHRIVARNKESGEYTELFVAWPPREGSRAKGRGVTLNRDLTPEDLEKFFSGDYWIDLHENKPREDGGEFARERNRDF